MINPMVFWGAWMQAWLAPFTAVLGMTGDRARAHDEPPHQPVHVPFDLHHMVEVPAPLDERKAA